MIKRYTNDYMEKLWSEKNRFDTFLAVELAVVAAWHKQGVVPSDDYKLIKANSGYKISDILAFEAQTKHDVIAFVKAVSLSLGAEKKWLHYGLTSTDVVDSALAITLKKVNSILRGDLVNFIEVLKKLALQYKNTPAIGRTHGVHAEITSFGLKFLLYYDQMNRNLKRFDLACSQVEVIKLSGAVGNYVSISPAVEDFAAKELKMNKALIATQVLARDSLAFYLATISLIATTLEQIATEVRHLARSEVGEVKEYFSKDQKGSSAMPHKQNPIASENICGCSRVIKGYMQTAFDNVALWHERDISHSSAERIILPDATTLLDYMLTRYANTLDTLIVYPEQMLHNIGLTHNIIFSQQVLNQVLTHTKLSRQEAYDIIQALSQVAYKNKMDFKEVLLTDEAFSKILTSEQINDAFDINRYLSNVDYIYNQVLNNNQ